MIKLENYEVVGWEHAIRGMRNPMNSWEKSDSGWNANIPPLELRKQVDWSEYAKKYISVQDDAEYEYCIGPNDQALMMKLAKAGPVHGKYRRMIEVYVDITAPLYWWKEFDTYKVGTVANSCSTMHKIHEKEFEMSDFSTDHLLPASFKCLGFTVKTLNEYRNIYLNGFKGVPGDDGHDVPPRDKKYWHQLIQLLPTSYNQKRTVMLDYEVLANIYEYRKDHKLDEWRDMCKWIESLPYSEIITGKEDSK